MTRASDVSQLGENGSGQGTTGARGGPQGSPEGAPEGYRAAVVPFDSTNQHFAGERWDGKVREYPDGDREACLYPVVRCRGAGEKGRLAAAIDAARAAGNASALSELEGRRVRMRRQDGQRARANVRRIVKASGMRTMWTFTFPGDGVHDYPEAAALMEEFVREIRRFHSGVYLIVPELHPGGHGWHFHVGVRHYMAVLTVRRRWTAFLASNGHAYAGLVQVDVTSTSSANVGRYLSKYLTKTFEAGSVPEGLWRYRPGRGVSRPVTMKVENVTPAAFVEWVAAQSHSWTAGFHEALGVVLVNWRPRPRSLLPDFGVT